MPLHEHIKPKNAPPKVSDAGLDTDTMEQRRQIAGPAPRVFIQGRSGVSWLNARRRSYASAARRALRGDTLTDAEMQVLQSECPASVTIHFH